MVDPHDLTTEIYDEIKYSSKITTLNLVFVTASLIIFFKISLCIFSPLLEIWNGPQKRIHFHFTTRISKLCSVWYLFKIKLPKSYIVECLYG